MTSTQVDVMLDDTQVVTVMAPSRQLSTSSTIWGSGFGGLNLNTMVEFASVPGQDRRSVVLSRIATTTTMVTVGYMPWWEKLIMEPRHQERMKALQRLGR